MAITSCRRGYQRDPQITELVVRFWDPQAGYSLVGAGRNEYLLQKSQPRFFVPSHWSVALIPHPHQEETVPRPGTRIACWLKEDPEPYIAWWGLLDDLAYAEEMRSPDYGKIRMVEWVPNCRPGNLTERIIFEGTLEDLEDWFPRETDGYRQMGPQTFYHCGYDGEWIKILDPRLHRNPDLAPYFSGIISPAL